MADGSSITIRRAARVRPKLLADLFCGAGGMSNGALRAMRELGLPVSLVGVNHWPIAIETNRRNHREHAGRIACADLETALPLDHVPEGYLDLLMAAPSCVFHSRARGGRPVHDQQRMDPWHVVRWCTELRVKRIVIENVPEFMDWGPCSLVTGRPIPSRRGEYFRAWVAALEAVGFRVDWRVLCCADYGDPTTRRRFFLIGRSDGGRLTWPEPSHGRARVDDLLGDRPKWRGATEIIDWADLGTSIFTRRTPLRPNTVRRILAGAVRYAWPQPYIDALQALLDGREPVLDVPAEDAEPLLIHLRGTHEHAIQNGTRSASEPLPTLTAGGRHVGLVMATGAGGVARSTEEPIPTVTAGGDGGARPHFIAPSLVAPYYGGGSGLTAQSVQEPVPAVTTKCRFGLVVPLSNSSSAGTPRATDEPIRTVTTAKGGDQALAVAHMDGVRIDICYRMLRWRELARATSFDDEGEVYDFAGTATEITKQIGNAVPNRTSKALVRELMKDAA